MLLCQVCSRWTVVATDYASLWTTLRLELLAVTLPSEPALTRHLRQPSISAAWLQHCKHTGVNLQVAFSYVARSQPSGSDQSMFFTSLMTCPPTFNLRNLTLSRVAIHSLYHSLPKGAFPFLERLALQVSNRDPDSGEIGHRTPIVAFEDCPMLHHVGLRGFVGGALVDQINLPWHQITHFIFHEKTNSEVLYLCAKQMKQLQFAHFAFDDEPRNLPGPASLESANHQATFGKLKGLSVS
ncbi:hypothetical protein BKA70DRAFT_1452380 [Coprinopsis sp. MPI-PUGE-AT-0042]|nr:hypothetical protein BKA70DRAFT_1452380 [Coprinopsis sp. MPI-PUGE-AT-0042]